jgi:hypothetical protein
MTAVTTRRAVSAAMVAGWLLFGSVVAGCGDDDTDGTAAVTTDSSQPATSQEPEPPLSSISTEPQTTRSTSTEPQTITSTSTEPQTTTSTTASPSTVIGELVAANNGLTLVSFGEEAEAAIAVLTGVLGSPDVDTGWQDPSDPASEPLWPGCPGATARLLQWTGNLGVLFTDWNGDLSTPRGSVSPPYFAGYGLWPTTSIRTVDGASSGMTLAEARAIYGDRLSVSDRPDDAVELFSFAIDGTGSPLTRTGSLRGWLFPPGTDSGQPADSPSDEWTIGALTAGVSCSTP